MLAIGAAAVGNELISRPQLMVVSAPPFPRMPTLPELPVAAVETNAARARPVASEHIPLAASDDRLVRLAVERYQGAMDARARTHPTESAEKWAIDSCVVTVGEDAATATCRGVAVAGPQRSEPLISTFTLRRTLDGWRILAVMPGA